MAKGKRVIGDARKNDAHRGRDRVTSSRKQEGHIGGQVVIMKVPQIQGLSEKEAGTRGFMRDSLELLVGQNKIDRQTWAKVMTAGNKHKHRSTNALIRNT